MFRLRMALSALLFTGVVAQGTQIFTNPGFETGSLTPWISSGSWAITNSGCNSGNFCAIDTGNNSLEQDFAAVATSSISQVSFFALNTSGAVTALAYDYLYQGGGFDEFIVNTSGTGWNFFDVTAQIRPSDTLVGFRVFGNSGGTTITDDLNITTGAAGVPEPATFGLLFSGLGAIALIAKRRRTMSVS